MLKQFDSLYAGHVDLENIGYGGTPINDRRFEMPICPPRWAKRSRWRNSWTGWDIPPSGWPNTTSSVKAPSASPTCC